MSRRRKEAKAMRYRKSQKSSDVTRHETFRAEDINEDKRTVNVAFASQTPIRVFGVDEVLLHEPGAVDLKPLRSAGAVLFNHREDMPIGRPTNVRLDAEDRVTRATAVLDDDEDGEKIFRKIRSKTIRGVSVRARIHEWRMLRKGEAWTSPGGQEFKGPVDIAVKWDVREFSFVSVPADHSVGVGRSDNGDNHDDRSQSMNPTLKAALVKRGLSPDASDEEAEKFLLELIRGNPGVMRELGPEGEDESTEGGDEDGGDEDGAETDSVDEDGDGDDQRTLTATAEDVVRRERERVAEIQEMCDMHDCTRSLASKLCKDGTSVSKARKIVLRALREELPTLAPQARRIDHGEGEREKFRSAAIDWMHIRTTGLTESVEPDAGKRERRIEAAHNVEFISLMDCARSCLKREGRWKPAMARSPDMVLRALSHSESDFPNILESVANKNLMDGFNNQPSTWERVARVGSNPDFKNKNYYQMGDSGELEETDDLVPMPEGTFPESKETAVLVTYAKRFGIGRKALINDDMGAFTDIPAKMGAAARRKPNTLFYNLLTSASGLGPTMAEDSVALFSASHTSGSNYTASGGAPDVAALSAALALFRKQKNFVDSNETAAFINVTPTVMLVPPELEGTARELLNSAVNPASSNDTGNIYNRAFELVVEAELSGKTDGTTAWYLASPNGVPSSELLFLNGRREPQTIRVEGNNTLGIEWGVYLDCVAKFFNHRGWYRNKGAA